MSEPTERREDDAVQWYYRDVQIETAHFHTEEPQDPEVGTHWYDPETKRLCVWDGAEWELVPED